MSVVRSAKELAKFIDHTNLNPAATEDDIRRLCEEAKSYGFYAVCVNPANVRLCHRLLAGTDIKIASVVSFPFGASKPEAKAFEAEAAIDDGADELDFVINVGALRSGNLELVENDMKAVASVAKRHGKISKAILETGYLTEDQKRIACKIAVEAGVDFVKTSTGYGPSGASVADVITLREATGGRARVKAAGGIRTAKQAIELIEAGASRIGTSHGVDIVSTFGETGTS